MLRSIRPTRATSLAPASAIGPSAAAGIAPARSHPGRPGRRRAQAGRRASSSGAAHCLGSWPPVATPARPGGDWANRPGRASSVPDGADRPSGTGPGLFATSRFSPPKKHKQPICESSVVMPSARATVSSCEAPCKAKKECFLKTWLHHKAGCKNKKCKGCKPCAYCGEAPAMVSAQQW
jgi:hypothetical protein